MSKPTGVVKPENNSALCPAHLYIGPTIYASGHWSGNSHGIARGVTQSTNLIEGSPSPSVPT